MNLEEFCNKQVKGSEEEDLDIIFPNLDVEGLPSISAPTKPRRRDVKLSIHSIWYTKWYLVNFANHLVQ